MLVSGVWSRVRDIAGDVAQIQYSTETLTNWTNDAIREIVLENKLTQKSASQNTVVGQQEYVLPVDIYKLYSIILDGQKIELITLQQWEAMNASIGSQNNGNQRPTQAYIWAGKLNLLPKPDAIYSLKINYIYLPTELNPLTEVGATDLVTLLPVPYHARLASYLLAQIAQLDEDFEKYERLMQEFKTGVVAISHSGENEEDLYPFMSVSTRDMGDGSWEYYGG